MSGFALPPEQPYVDITNQAQAWVAEFAPLVMDDTPLTEREVHERLDILERLRDSGPKIQTRLNAADNYEHSRLASTMEHAISQIDSIETDLRKRLARLSPGDPEGIVDLNTLQERLEQRSAKLEMGVPTDLEIPPVLKLKLSPGNIGGALFIGLFGLGWTAFTTFHAVLMIGGMLTAFGWPALFMLLFYSIFFAAGFAMFAAAYNAAANEEIELDGYELTIRKTLFGIKREKKYRLPQDAKAECVAKIMEVENEGFRQSNSRKTVTAIVMTDDQDRQITFGAAASQRTREKTVEHLNAYLSAQE
ncbi:MAG: hypothetical protein KF784_06125 [Fimbriimonadaceae bacterium]|nr:hypothetical protein [Fimbriimonadaceae bacterium]